MNIQNNHEFVGIAFYSTGGFYLNRKKEYDCIFGIYHLR